MKKKASDSLFTTSNVGHDCAMNCYRIMFEIERADSKDAEGSDLGYTLELQRQEGHTPGDNLSNSESANNLLHENCADREINLAPDSVKLPGERSFYDRSARDKRVKFERVKGSEPRRLHH